MQAQLSDDAYAALLDTRTIWRSEVGSTGHGVTHASNDIDEIAVYVPPVDHIVALNPRPEHFIYRPGRGPHDPSGPGDLDRTYYSLRRFVELLYAGNPSILYALFAPMRSEISTWGIELRALGPLFRTEKTRKAYLGYMQRQRERITGERGSAGRMRRSPEGGGEIDWKYAMHMVRLGVQGHEYLTTGHVSAPSLELDVLLMIRQGLVSLEKVLELTEQYEERIRGAELPDYGAAHHALLSGYVYRTTLEYWASNGDINRWV